MLSYVAADRNDDSAVSGDWALCTHVRIVTFAGGACIDAVFHSQEEMRALWDVGGECAEATEYEDKRESVHSQAPTQCYLRLSLACLGETDHDSLLAEPQGEVLHEQPGLFQC